MFGRKKQESNDQANVNNFLDPLLTQACKHYVAGPGLHVGLRALPDGAETDWDDGVQWNLDRLQRILIVHIEGSMGWISFLQRPDGYADASMVTEVTRLINPLTVKYGANNEGHDAESMKALVESIDGEHLRSLSPIEIEVRASRSDSQRWTL